MPTNNHSSEDPPRGTITLPDQIDFPRLLDFYELQDIEHTQIHTFYENLREGKLTTTQCTSCGAVHYPPRIVCPECMSDELEYTSIPHQGELYSFTEVRGTAPISMNEEMPFVVGIVDLGEIRLSSQIDEAVYSELSIGDPVQLKIMDIEGPTDQQRVFYRFVPR